MNRIIKISSFLGALLAVNVSFAQDIHFSMYSEAPVNVNPALITTAYDTRVIGNYRTQWGSVAKAYTTYGVSFEQAIRHLKLKKNYIGLALNINSDKAGDAKLGSLMPSIGVCFVTKSSKLSKMTHPHHFFV